MHPFGAHDVHSEDLGMIPRGDSRRAAKKNFVGLVSHDRDDQSFPRLPRCLDVMRIEVTLQ